MKFEILAAAVLLAAAGAPALADTIDFSQFGGEFTALPGNPLTGGLTQGGVNFSISSAASAYEILKQGSSWGGQFNTGAAVLYDEGASGPVTISFDGSVSNLTLAFEDNMYGAYSATATAYDGTTVVGMETLSSVSAFAPGTAPVFNLSGAGITSVVISSSADGYGWGLSVASVPEPATWAMMLLGALAVGVALRRARKPVLATA